MRVSPPRLRPRPTMEATVSEEDSAGDADEHGPDRRTLVDPAEHTDNCRYNLRMELHEQDATDWLLRVLNSMCEKRGPNFARASVARSFISRLATHSYNLHRRVHEAEAETANLVNSLVAAQQAGVPEVESN